MPRPPLFTAPDWLVILGITLASIAALWLLTLVALRIRDRRRSATPHCPHCFYNMSGTPGLKCPECGHEARTNEELHRVPRRRLGLLLALVLLVLAAPLADARRLSQIDWIARAPTRLLLLFVPDSAWGGYGPIVTAQTIAREELWLRDARDQLSADDRRALVRRQFASRPPVTLISRDRWPTGAHVLCDLAPACPGVRPRELVLYAPGSNRILLRTWIESQVYLPGLTLSHLGGAAAAPPRLDIGILADGEHHLDFALELLERGQVVWSGSTTITCTVGGDLDTVVRPLVDARVDDALREDLRAGVWISPKHDQIGVGIPVPAVGREVCFPMRFELVRRGRVLAQASIIGTNSSGSPLEWWAPLEPQAEGLSAADFSDGTWTIRIRSDPVLALQDFAADAYWSGQFEVPAKGVIKPVSDTRR